MTADVVVIGSGPGGAVTATLLAEQGYSVLMIEEGPNLPIQSAPHFSYEEMLQKYRNGGVTVALGVPKIAYVEGCCVGGGSEINRGIYHRAPDSLLERWRQEFGVSDLSHESMAPHFDACEATAHIEYLGNAAPAMSRRLFEGAQSLGWRAMEAPRLFSYAAGGGRKQSMSETFVPRFLEAGGRLIVDTRVDKLTRTGGKWRINARNRGGDGSQRQVEISADQVFVACGAVQTPALLRRSGLTKNIGDTLRFHPMLKLVAEFAEQINRHGDPDPVHQVKEFEPDIGMGCSISNLPMLTLAMANHPEQLAGMSSNWQRMGIYYVQTTEGVSSVRNLPFFRDPLVRMKHGASGMPKLARGLKLLAEALFAAGAVAVYPGIAGYPALRSMDDVHKLPDVIKSSDGSITSVHVFSSCPMGENEALCATDSFGRVRGADGLYIADASLLCTATGVNPQGTVMAVAHRNALHAIEKRFH
jgi:choline dehydrogenase-like flavoprotein